MEYLIGLDIGTTAIKGVIVSTKGEVLNTVGAGDSMVAGFVKGFLDSRDFDFALKLGSACGSATAFSVGLASIDKINELLEL